MIKVAVVSIMVSRPPTYPASSRFTFVFANKIRRLNVDQHVSDRELCMKLGSQERIVVHAQCNDRSPISSALPLGLSLYQATASGRLQRIQGTPNLASLR